MGGNTKRKPFDDGDYPLLKDWYDEWVKINKAMIGVSFAVIAFTITVFDIGTPESTLSEARTKSMTLAWIFLIVSSGLSGFSICVAYIWIDSIRRRKLYHLKGVVFIAGYVIKVYYIGTVGWILSLASVGALVEGI